MVVVVACGVGHSKRSKRPVKTETRPVASVKAFRATSEFAEPRNEKPDQFYEPVPVILDLEYFYAA